MGVAGTWNSRMLVKWCAVGIVLMTLGSSAQAQVLYGSLTGNLTDASGSAVPGAKVEALNVGTGVSKQAVSDDRGTYLFSDLQPGMYKVTVAAPAFSARVFENVAVTLNSVLRLDAQLSVSQVSETINVSAGTALLQTDRS